MSEVLSAAGPMGMAVVGLGGLGALVAVGLAGLSFTKRRVPLAAFVLVPFLVCILGALAAWSNAGEALTALGAADAATLNQAALDALWTSVTVDWLSRWVAAFVLVVCAWCAGVGATVAAGPSDEAVLTPLAAVEVALTAVLGAGALTVYGGAYGLKSEAFLLTGVLLIGGLGVAFASVRRSLYEHAYRVAGMRFVSAACFMIAMWFGARAVAMGTQIDMFGPGGTAQGLPLADAVALWGIVADPVWMMSAYALAFAALIVFFSLYAELGEVVQRYTLVDLWATGALALVLVGARGIESSRTDTLDDIGTHEPARVVFDDWGNDLPTTVVQVDRQPVVTRPGSGGYGDVLVFRDFRVGEKPEGGPLMKREWRRIRVWDGNGWYHDDSPLSCEGHTDPCAEITPNGARPPLLAIGKGEDAVHLMAAARKIPGGEFMLLMRATDGTLKGPVPYYMAHRQISVMPIKLDAPVDRTKEVWVDAGYKEMFWGPTHWYGEGDDKEPILYARAIFADTQSPGLHVLVSERARVEGVANSCLAARVHYDDEKGPSVTDRWCSITEGEVDAWRQQARDVWPVPTPETVTARARAEGPIDADFVTDVFLRETGAVARCQQLAHEQAYEDFDPDDPGSELAATDGVMEFSVVINDRGRINGTYVEDRSKLQNAAISRCVAGRYRKLDFEPLPEPEPTEDGTKPEPPSATVYVTYDFKKLPELQP